MRYKVGDRVLIRQWDDMEKHYGVDAYGTMALPGEIYFNMDMKKHCGTVLTVSQVSESEYRMKETVWIWNDSMIERKVDMTKADLKDGMVCRTSDGETFIWLNGMPRNNKHIISCVSHDLNNGLSSMNCDIVEVYETRGDTLMNMLDVDRYGTLIWKREEPKEMTVAEIEKALGHPVKIVKEGGK